MAATSETADGEFKDMQRDISRVCGYMAMNMNMIGVAFEVLCRNLTRNPYDLETLLLLCNLYLKNRDYGNVLELLGEPIEKGWPLKVLNDKRIWTRLALAHYHMCEFSESLLAIDKAIKISNNEDPNAMLLQCRVLLKLPMVNYPLISMVPFFEKTLKMTQSQRMPALHVEALLSRAQLFKKYGEFDKARTDLSDSMSILNNAKGMHFFDKRDFLHKVCFTYILAATVQENYEKALLMVNSAIDGFDHTQESVQPLIEISTVLHCILRKDLERQLDTLITLVDCVPVQFRAMLCYLISRVLLELDPILNVNRAYQYILMAVDLDEENILILVSLGFLYFNMKRINSSLSIFSKVINLCDSHGHGEPKNNIALKILAWYGIAKNYFTAGDMDKANKALTNLRTCNDEMKGTMLGIEIDPSLVQENCVVNFDIPLRLLFDIIQMDESNVFKINERAEKEDILTLSSMSGCATPPKKIFNQSSMPYSENAQIHRKKRGKKSSKHLKKANDIFRNASLSVSKGFSQKAKKRNVSSNSTPPQGTSTSICFDQRSNVSKQSPSYDLEMQDARFGSNENLHNFYRPQITHPDAGSFTYIQSPPPQYPQSINLSASMSSPTIYYTTNPYFNAQNRVPSDLNTAQISQFVMKPVYGEPLYVFDNQNVAGSSYSVTIPNGHDRWITQ